MLVLRHSGLRFSDGIMLTPQGATRAHLSVPSQNRHPRVCAAAPDVITALNALTPTRVQRRPRDRRSCQPVTTISGRATARPNRPTSNGAPNSSPSRDSPALNQPASIGSAIHLRLGCWSGASPSKRSPCCSPFLGQDHRTPLQAVGQEPATETEDSVRRTWEQSAHGTVAPGAA